MSVLWIIVFLILICSIVWMALDHIHVGSPGNVGKLEGFQPAEPSTWDALRDFFHYQVSPVEDPDGIPIAVGPGTADLIAQVDRGIETPDWGSASAKSQSLAKHFYDPRGRDATEDEKCRSLGNPRQLASSRAQRPKSQIAEESGCGWWFVADPETPSVAAFGYGPNTTRATETGEHAQGAAREAVLPTGGRWIWDIAAATQAEDVKRCKRIKTCSLISGEESVDCGFCGAKGYAVPVKAGTNELLYPTDPDGNCGDAANIIVDARKCKDITIQPRYYSGDYNYDMNGNPIRDELYERIKNPKGITEGDPCVLENGRLTKACRLLMCEELAKCTKDKGLHRIIQSGVLTETDHIAVYFVSKRGAVDLTEALWAPMEATHVPPLSKADAAALMQKLYTTATSGPPSQMRGAALWLLNETPFNPCDFNDGDMPMKAGDTFPLECVQREFRKAGCQAAGAGYPTSTTDLKAFEGMSYGAIRTQFRDLYARMNRLDDFKTVRQQDETIKQCLGVEVQRAADTTLEENPNVCRERGIEYWFTTIPTVGSRILYAQRLVREEPLMLVGEEAVSEEAGKPAAGMGTVFMDLLNKRGGNRGWTARTYVEVQKEALMATLTVPTDVAAFYGFWVNRQQINPQTGTPHIFRAYLHPYTRNELEVRFEGAGSSALHFGTPRLSFASTSGVAGAIGATAFPPLYLAQSAWKPVISLRAFKDGLKDENHFLQLDTASSALAMAPERMGGAAAARWAAPLKGLSIKSLQVRGIWMDAVGTVATMLYLSALPTGQATLWRLDQGNGGSADTIMSLQCLNNGTLVWTVQSGTSLFQVRSKSVLKTGWNHIAIVVGNPLSATRIYLQGVDTTAALADGTATGTLYPEQTAFTRVVLGGPGIEGGLAWFHIYGTTLSAAQIGRDLNYDNPKYSQIDGELMEGRYRGPLSSS